MAQVFVSYKSDREAQALALVKRLETVGIDCWIACRDISIGSDYMDEIPQAIDDSPYFLLLLSRNTSVSPWIKMECKHAISRGKYILPVKIEDCTLSSPYTFMLQNYQIDPLYTNLDKQFREIAAKILRCGPKHPPEECFRLGRQRYFGQQKNTPETAILFLEAALQGHAEAQFYYANCLLHGYGTDQDEKEAFSWFCRSADGDHLPAVSMVGYCLETGKGTEKDPEQAVVYYRRAADRGDAGAQANLGVCYGYAKGINQDWSEAVRLFTLAAEQGHSGAQRHLGSCYENAWGVTEDLRQAEKWYRAAADQGDSAAAKKLEELQKRLAVPTVDGIEPYLYVSCAQVDYGRVKSLVEGLEKLGFRVRMDTGSNWPDYLAEQIRNCSCFVPMISERSLQSRYCQNEISDALQCGKPMVAVHLEDIPLPDSLQLQLSRQQILRFTRHKDERAFLELLSRMPVVAACRKT